MVLKIERDRSNLWVLNEMHLPSASTLTSWMCWMGLTVCLHNGWYTGQSSCCESEEAISSDSALHPSLSCGLDTHCLPYTGLALGSLNPTAFPLSHSANTAFSFSHFLPFSSRLHHSSPASININLSSLFLFLPLSFTETLKGSVTEPAEWGKEVKWGKILEALTPHCFWDVSTDASCQLLT